MGGGRHSRNDDGGESSCSDHMAASFRGALMIAGQDARTDANAEADSYSCYFASSDAGPDASAEADSYSFAGPDARCHSSTFLMALKP